MNFDLKINDFIEKIKNIIKGNQLNFYISNDEFYEYILEFFGDKEFIVKNYRDIINSLKNEDFFSFYYFTEKIYFYFCKNYLLCLEINQYNCHKFKNQIYTGINIMILLLELNRYIRKVNKVDRKITFYPSGNPKIQKEENKLNFLSYLINSLNYIDSNNFVKIIDNHLSGAILTNADLSNVNLNYINLIGTDLTNANLIETKLCSANLIKSNLTNGNLNRAVLINTNLKYSLLNKANLNYTNLMESNFMYANLVDSNLSGANLRLVNFNSANLTRANLSFTTVQYSNLTNANLCNCNFFKADLYNAKLNKANLKNASFNQADLTYTNFTEAVNITTEQIKVAQNWQKAKYDKYFALKLGL